MPSGLIHLPSAPTVDVPLTIVGTPTIVVANNGTFGTHAPGDLLVAVPYRRTTATAITKPSAGGTVPAWVDIDNNPGADSNAARAACAVAVASNHTTGTWTNTEMLLMVVLRNQDATTPIGGHAESGSTGTSSVAPAVTLDRTDGSSVILHIHGVRGGTTWATAPAGYTRRAAIAPGVLGGLCLNTKDDTTSDGSVSQGAQGSALGYRGLTIEIRSGYVTTSPYSSEFTPAGNTIDTDWWGQNSGGPNGIVQTAGVLKAANGTAGSGGPNHYYPILAHKNVCATNQMYFEGVLTAANGGGDYGDGFFVGGDSPTAMTSCMMYLCNSNNNGSPNGSHGWVRRTGGGVSGWTDLNRSGSNPVVMSADDVIRVRVRKSGQDWVYEAFRNGVLIPNQGTYVDVGGAVHGVPGGVCGIGQWVALFNFSSYTGNGVKGPFKIGDL